MISAPVSGTFASTSRSRIPLPRWMAPGKWSFANSLSSRTSTRWNFSPRSSRTSTCSTVHSLMRVFASCTICRKRGACCAAMIDTSLSAACLAQKISFHREQDPPVRGIHFLIRMILLEAFPERPVSSRAQPLGMVLVELPEISPQGGRAFSLRRGGAFTVRFLAEESFHLGLKIPEVGVRLHFGEILLEAFPDRLVR